MQQAQQEFIDPNLDLERVRLECLDLVKKRAYVSAGVAIVPIPFFDLVMDVSILSQLIPEINARFGLAPERASVYDPKTKTVHWGELRRRGVDIAGMVASRATVKASLQGFFTRMVTKQFSKFVPLGGQMVSASLGYVMMKKIATAHVEESYILAKKLRQKQQGTVV